MKTPTPKSMYWISSKPKVDTKGREGRKGLKNKIGPAGGSKFHYLPSHQMNAAAGTKPKDDFEAPQKNNNNNKTCIGLTCYTWWGVLPGICSKPGPFSKPRHPGILQGSNRPCRGLSAAMPKSRILIPSDCMVENNNF
jgi:hypothetical protein